MYNLKNILEILKEKRESFKSDYYIPEAWNVFGYDKAKADIKLLGQLRINPYDFLTSCIEDCILKRDILKKDYLKPLEINEGNEDSYVSKSAIYSMFPRMLTAWDHYNNGELVSGTFLKAICYLPYLMSIGINIVYLLPVFEISNKCKKGEVPSPYAIKNIYKLDRNLHDGLLGDFSEELIDMQFKGFIETCHILGIKVMVDFVFRTVSRDNDLVIDHPDWFYWIDIQHKETFSCPYVKSLKEHTMLNDKTLKSLYKTEGVGKYLEMFKEAPNKQDESKWALLKEDYNLNGKNILDLIESDFEITTAPGFSNVLNDPQPPWTDVTYVKFYLDNHKKVEKLVSETQVPYILQDGIGLSLYHGEVINSELWEYVAGVIPYYQNNFGIDGARIDMGHALPTELNKEIVKRTKQNNNNFLLWSEEFHVENSKAAKDDGFHFISGSIWSIYKDLEKKSFSEILLDKTVLKSYLPIAAAMETPDTPRAALVHEDRKRLQQLAVINCFIPNTIPFINNGFEVLEKQPMNLGLDNTEKGRFVLEKDDTMYGKLAFFDNYSLHWLNKEKEWIQKLLLKAFEIRKKYIDIISSIDNFILSPKANKSKKIFSLIYLDRKTSKNLFIIANRDFKERAKLDFAEYLSNVKSVNDRTIIIEYSTSGDNRRSNYKIDEKIFLQPGEVIIGYLQGGKL